MGFLLHTSQSLQCFPPTMSHLCGEMHDRVHIFGAEHETEEIHRLDVTLDELRVGGLRGMKLS